MSDMSPAEIERRLIDHGRLIDRRVNIDVYDRDRKQDREDIGEIKDALRWANRLILGQFAALIVAVLVFLLGRP
jgi:hypothetical protein